MKFLYLFGFVLVAGVFANTEQKLSNEQKMTINNKLLVLAIECYHQYPITAADVYVFKRKMVPDDETAKCFTNCMFKKTGVMNEQGMVSPAQARKRAENIFKGDEERLINTEKIMELCSAVNNVETKDGDKGCDRAKLAYECLLENAPKYGFDFEV